MLNQKLQQKMLQKLSPQQIQLMKLLQVPSVELEQRIKEEIEENPALEDAAESQDEEQEQENPETQDEEGDDETEPEIVEKAEDDFSLDDYIDSDDIPDYKLSVNNNSQDDEDRQIPFVSGVSFFDSLNEQLGFRNLSARQRAIGEYLIGSLDENGYLAREVSSIVNDLTFSANISVEESEILDVLYVIQDLEPAGVGARNLQECLLIQIGRLPINQPGVKHAKLILEKGFIEFSKKHYDKIQKRLGLTEEDLKLALEEILKLNPKPGNSQVDASRSGSQHVFPDFTILNEDGDLELVLNSRNLPELRVNRTYSDMLETYVKAKSNDSKTKEAIQFVKQKIDSARWFIDALRQRQNTLYTTMKAIMDYQKEYFLSGDETKLKPMILKDISEIVGLDISTISRVASSKYVQTPFGTLKLKSFFSESMQTESGEEVSTREIKSILTELINAENKRKPLTDDYLTSMLKAKGYNIARRTVAKYREQLDIPVARMRKEL